MSFDITPFTSGSQVLQQSMSILRTQTSPEVIEEAVIERRRFKTKIKEQKALLSRQINELRDYQKVLDILDDHQADDISELTAKKWELVMDRKENRFNGQSGVSTN